MLNKKLLFMAAIIVMGMDCRSLATIAETDRSRNFPAEISVQFSQKGGYNESTRSLLLAVWTCI